METLGVVLRSSSCIIPLIWDMSTKQLWQLEFLHQHWRWQSRLLEVAVVNHSSKCFLGMRTSTRP